MKCAYIKDAENRQKILIFVVLFIVSFILYGDSLRNGFVFDDHQIIVNNPSIKNWPKDLGLFTSNYWFETHSRQNTVPNNYYRPITLLSFAIDYQCWGANPIGFHLTNIFLFGLTLVVLFLLVEISFQSLSLALLAALVYGANPIHGEVVSFVGGRTDLLAGLFAVGAIHLYWTWRKLKKTIYLVISLVLWLMALGSKESAVTAPFIIAGMELTFGGRGLRIWRREYFLYLIILAIYAALRFLALSGHTPWQGDSYDLTAVGTIPEKVWRYLNLTILPVNLSAYYTDRFTPTTAGLIGGIVLLILPVVVTFAPWFKNNRVPIFASQIFIWGLLPSLGFVRNTSNVEFAERFAFLSSFGVSLAIAWFFLTAARKACCRILTAAIISVLLTYSAWMGYMTFRRNSVWRNDLTLFQEMARTAPKSYLAHFNLGNELAKRGRFIESERHYKMAIELDSTQFDVFNNLGTLHFYNGRWGEAEKCFSRAAIINSSSPVIRFNCGLASLRQGKREEAIAWFKKALELDPMFKPAQKALENLR
jgi:hypothetical protein